MQLNGADGLEWATIFDCAQIYRVKKAKVSGVMGRVTVERRRQVSRKIVEAYRLIL